MMEDNSVRLANLYLYHAIAFVYNVAIINFRNENEEPNEKIMRLIESEAQIAEADCVKFRNIVVEQLVDFRMDYLYNQMKSSLDSIIDNNHELVEEWFEQYPNLLPLVVPKVPN